MPPLIVHLIAAARPNFMKVAPLYHALRREKWCTPKIVHTGQHYDPNMSDAFFADLQLPEPDHHLDVGSGTHAEQTGRVMIADRDLPGNRLESLKGDRKGQYSIRVNDQWRICFEWPKGSKGPTSVEIVDYH